MMLAHKNCTLRFGLQSVLRRTNACPKTTDQLHPARNCECLPNSQVVNATKTGTFMAKPHLMIRWELGARRETLAGLTLVPLELH